jgi:hypothetical protein
MYLQKSRMTSQFSSVKPSASGASMDASERQALIAVMKLSNVSRRGPVDATFCRERGAPRYACCIIRPCGDSDLKHGGLRGLQFSDASG